jgi:site-specific DNA recombinase
VRCGYCTDAMRVLRARPQRRQTTTYRCARGSKYRSDCTQHGIATRLMDTAVWGRVEAILTRPEIVVEEVARLQADDPTADDLAAAEKALANVRRQQDNLVEQLANVGGAVANLVTEKLAALEAKREQFASERDAILLRQRAWKTASQRLEDLEAWCRSVAANLGDLAYDQKRLALDALGVRVFVWRADHTPRYTIEATIPLSGEHRHLVADTCPEPGKPSSGEIEVCRRACRKGPAGG